MNRTLATGIAALLFALAVAIRLYDAYAYPPDWGFDASFNWRYIYRLTQDRSLPPPHAGWATADPPLFFVSSAALMVATDWHIEAVPLMNVAAGLAVVALAMALVGRAAPPERRRVLLAGGLLLYLPAHFTMSFMSGEEMLATLFISLAIYLLMRPPLGTRDERFEIGRAAGVGLAAGLAILTKLSGVIVLMTAALSIAALSARGALRRTGAALAVLALVAGLSGGWFYARNKVLYGYFQPFGLPAHQSMFEQPPGERGAADYVRLPLATFTDPQLLHEDLLHSVWGSTLATVWFDGHRYLLPRDDENVRRLGTATMLLALLPTFAFLAGLARGVRRVARGERDEAPLLLLVGLTLAGYAAYTWRNPWFTVLKGTTLLGLCLPYAWYASETLADWTDPKRRGPLPHLVWLGLAGLVVCVVLSCTFGLAFEKTEVPGLPWGNEERP